MSLIKFPTQIKPARVTVQLSRVDETIASPITNIQQVVARGNPAWKWTYEFTDLTDSERDIVQAFLLKCKGSVNTFKISDPGDYEIKGSMSDWIDIFSGYGSFTVDAGSDSLSINSWFNKSDGIDSEIGEDGLLRMARAAYTTNNLRWKGHGAGSMINSFAAGKTYVQRTKYFPGRNTDGNHFYLSVASGGDADILGTGVAGLTVKSADCITGPVVIGNDVSSLYATIEDSTLTGGLIEDYWEHADYRLMRCAMVANSENLLLQSNTLNSEWVLSTAGAVASGYADVSPTGVNSGAWRLFGAAVTNSVYFLSQTITKPNTEDIYTLAVYARSVNNKNVKVYMQAGGSAASAGAVFWLMSGTVNTIQQQGGFIRAHAEIWPVGSEWYRCQLTCLVNSHNELQPVIYVQSGGSTSWTNNGSEGIDIAHASLRKFPFMGPYCETTTVALVGSNYQTGSKLIIDGLDAEDIVKTGQRFEVVNRFHNRNTSVFERSEFKRTTANAKASKEGHVILEFDPPIRNAPVTDRMWAIGNTSGETMHNPVIFHKPELKARLMAGTIQYVDKPLKAMDIVFDVVEDMTE